MKDIKILLTACGAPGAPGIIKSLKINGEREITIIGTDMDPLATGRTMVDKFYQVPPGRDPDFTKKLFSIAKKEKVDTIYPLSTYELWSLSEKRESSEIPILVSNKKSIKTANNKELLFEKLKESGLGYCIPEFEVAENLDEFRQKIEKLGYPEEAVCFKPPVSKGSRGFRVIDNTKDRFDLLMNYKPDSSYTTFDEIYATLKSAEKFPRILVMEYLPGKEYSVDLLTKEGRSFVSIPRYREVIKLGISFKGRVEKNDELIKASKEIVKVLNLDFNINMQFKYDREGKPKLLEINPRASGTIVMCTGAGVNLPYLANKLALGEKLPEKIEPSWGTRMERYWKEVFYDTSGHAYTL